VIVSANRGYEPGDLEGAVDIVRKPVNVERLIAIVEQATAQQQQ
jgi:FixJ family two-component response regulator